MTDRPAVGSAVFEEFYVAERDRLVLFVCKLGASPEDAWDLAHEAFTKALEHWNKLENPAAWVRTVVGRDYGKYQCRSARERETFKRTAWVPRQDLVNFFQRYEWEQAYDAIALLPFEQRRVMAWHFDGYRPAEIAKALGIDQCLVRSNLRHARNKLKEMLILPDDPDTAPRGGTSWACS